MKITKDTQTVWRLENGHTIVGTCLNGYFIKTSCYTSEYTKSEMREVFGLTEDQFANIEKSGI